MNRKILLALIACLTVAVPVSVATASDEGTAPDALPPAGNYAFTVSPKSTVQLAPCRGAVPSWGKLKNGKLSTFAGTIDASGDILIPGSGLKGQFPKVSLDAAQCINIKGKGNWFQGTPTGVHDKKYTPANDWKGHLKKDETDPIESYLNAPINANSHIADSKFGKGDCWIGETKTKEGGYSSYIDLLLNKATYTTSGNKVSIKLTNDVPFDMPIPFEGVPPSYNPLLCSSMEYYFNRSDVAVIYKLTINGTNIG